MPAPAVYIIAIVGTVGAVIAFKEFVYEPHIAPAIDRWKAEYQAARRRRNEAAMHPEGDLPMSQTVVGKARPQESGQVTDNGDTSDDETPFGGHGKGSSASSSKFMKAGLLLRRPERGYERLHEIPDVELDNLVAREVNEWRSEGPSQALRQRKNVSEHAMDESIHAIPYTPLSPSRTHVVFDSSSPSTSSSGSRAPSPPSRSSPLSQPHPLLFSMTSGDINAGGSASPSPAPRTQDGGDSLIEKSSSPSPPTLASTATSVNQRKSPSPPVYPLPQSVNQFGNTPEIGPIVNVPSTPTSPPQVHPLQQSYTQSVPSLSQSYPQDLDYEHGLELLSPPSSRSLSPFSLAGMSPNTGSVNGQGLRTLSPFGSVSSRAASSTFSSAMSSPSPLRMDLGNESFDTLSPVGQARQLEVQGQAVSPFLDPPSPAQGSSVTNSARSTTYLSFADESSDDGGDDIGSHRAQGLPSANLGSSIGLEGTFGPRAGNVSPYPSFQPISRGASSASASGSNSNSLLFFNNFQGQGPREGMPTVQTPTQGTMLTPTQGVGPSRQTHADTLGLTFSPVSPREARTPAAAPVSGNSPGLTFAVDNDPSYFRPSSPTLSPVIGSGAHSDGHSPAPSPSDGELSDLDFMSESDYAPSEPSDLGNESGSDESWSVAGSEGEGSNTGSHGPRPGAANLTRGGTVRDARGGPFGSR